MFLCKDKHANTQSGPVIHTLYIGKVQCFQPKFGGFHIITEICCYKDFGCPPSNYTNVPFQNVNLEHETGKGSVVMDTLQLPESYPLCTRKTASSSTNLKISSGSTYVPADVNAEVATDGTRLGSSLRKNKQTEIQLD